MFVKIVTSVTSAIVSLRAFKNESETNFFTCKSTTTDKDAIFCMYTR